MPNGPTLILAPRGRDAAVIAAALCEIGVETRREASLAEFVQDLGVASAAVITEEALVHENKTDLARWIANQPPWSDLPFILLVLREAGNGRRSSELIELLGNVTVLERPLALTSLKSAVRAAIRGRARQRQSQQYLLELEELAATLERRVSERTAQLTRANQRLQAEIAERELTESALRQAQKMEALGQLTGGVAHDFNNLLMAMIGNLELLRNRVKDERLVRWTDNAMAAANRGARLVKQLLAFSRKQHLQPQPVAINDLMSDIEELISRTLGAGIVLDVVRDPGLWRATVDPNQLEMVILNLAINARDAMPNGGKLTIETKNLEAAPGNMSELAPGSYVGIAVSDTGHGMSQEIMARAFDPFFTTKPPGRGTGLGLSQVYGFARQSGGAVRIDSAPGRGTTVQIMLPRASEPVPRRQVGAAKEVVAAGGATILVVDDDEDVLKTASGMLCDLGYTVVRAADREQALESLRCHLIDVALIDLVMPHTSGTELAAQLRKLRPDLPVLFCSGLSDHRAAQSDEICEQNFIAKPYNGRELALKLTTVLAKDRSPVSVTR
jgi:signal transduction histidine kinase/ActR/RegA family two-component response regulator